MNNWKPSSFGELWQESFPDETHVQSFSSLLITIPIAILVNFSYFLYRFPIVGIQLFVFVHTPTFLQGVGLLLALLTSLLLYGFATFQQSFETIKSILRYLISLKGNFILEEYALEEYIGDDKVQEIKAARPVAWAKANQYPISRVFVRRSIRESTLPVQKKGFAAPVAYYYPGSPPQAISLIFIDESPDELSESSKFFVYHEIGHTTKHAWRVKTKPYIALYIIIFLGVWLFANTSNYMTTFLLFFVYFLIRSFLELNPFRNNFDDEVIADTFAIRRLPDDFPMTKQDNRRKNLEVILEKSLKVRNESNSYMQVFNRKRMENIKNMIQARKAERPFTIFEIARKPPVCDVLTLGVILISLAFQLHSLSIWFLIFLLTLSVVLFFGYSFIYWKFLIPGTNLIETIISELTCSGIGLKRNQ